MLRVPLRILLVEDNPTDAMLVETSLEDMTAVEAKMTHVTLLADAEAILESDIFDIVLLDLGLPDGQGLNNFVRLHAKAPNVPMVVLTGLADEEMALEAIARGASDYLIKGQTDAPLLERTTRYAIERKKNEKDRIELARAQMARAEAEAANQAKDEFLATLSHELRTPLNAILGWASLLKTGQLDAATQMQALDTIERNALVQAQLVEDLLDVSRIITGHLHLRKDYVSLADVTRAAANTLRPMAEAKNTDLQMDLAENLCVLGDATRMQQVGWNLISNAIKFSSKDGQVKVKLAGEENTAVLTVSDSGQGITAEFLPHIFDRFRQADSSTTRRHGGLGLGLAIVRTLVELHDGTVTGESAGAGQGAIFTVRLPLAAPAAAQPAVVRA